VSQHCMLCCCADSLADVCVRPAAAAPAVAVAAAAAALLSVFSKAEMQLSLLLGE
jgi:hypothetical protein